MEKNYEQSNFKIQNMVATAETGFCIRLEQLREEHKKFARCYYEPELFPGLIYRLEEPRLTLLVFVTGKLVICGAKERKDMYMAYKKIFPVLYQYKKANKNF